MNRNAQIEWMPAREIWEEIKKIIQRLNFRYVDAKRIVCFRSFNSTSYARARIWSFPRIWQLALKLPPYYIIEVISQHFDHLSDDDKKKVLIHELLHIPQNFSGSLLPHRGRGKRIDRRRVEVLFKQYQDLC